MSKQPEYNPQSIEDTAKVRKKYGSGLIAEYFRRVHQVPTKTDPQR